MTDLAQRCVQDFALCCQPVSGGASVLATIFEPQVIGPLADLLFDILRSGLLFLSGAPASLASEKADGRYAAGFAERLPAFGAGSAVS